MTRRTAAQVLVSKELNALLESLNPSDKLRERIEDMKRVLKENMLAGERVQKDRIPRYYIKKYGVNNLYRYDHSEGYRSCYTILHEKGIGYFPAILDVMSHKEYEKRFGY